MSELCSCLPDKTPEECMFGRTREIQQVKEIVQSETVAVVLITGGPGYGKTTVAKKVAHELATPDNERTVLFCSLLGKRNINEVATDMIHYCDRVHTHVPEYPEQWIKDWSKQIKTRVTFVLDNADDVLESEDRSSFLNMLSAVRMLSRQHVTFVVTSRKIFNDPDLKPGVVELKQLSVEDAKNILISQVKARDQDVLQKFPKAERIVELCGGNPLALCIVGSLLSDTTEGKLIKHLEEEPLTVLDDGETSVENVIRTSFDLLTKPQQYALILMSVFPGQFDLVAADAVMEACPVSRTLPGSILRSLRMRSLLEKPGPSRYQMHPLIQVFAKKIGVAKYPDLVAGGKKIACAHFMSCLAENSNRYWSKGSCREPVEAFNADRNSFEYFLQIYAQGREKEDCDIMESCEAFLDDLPQMCMYLEMCLLPRFYISILERLLETFDSETHPVHRVELLCLLGHEYRKAGDKEKYRKLMMEADEVRTKNHAEFKANVLTEVYFRNSFIRYLSHKKDPNENERIGEETDAVLKVSRELGEHPERAATLLYAGIFQKREKNWDEAEQKLNEALNLFKKVLGQHFMTAQSHKAIADLYFFHQKSEGKAELDICFEHYAESIKMIEDLGMIESKESILTLKNFGQCHMMKSNFNEAMNYFAKSGKVAEKELEADHKWKVWIATALATLHDKMGNRERAKAIMREGLWMAKRLNQPIDEMSNKDYIREFMSCHPEIFLESEFPRDLRGLDGRSSRGNVYSQDTKRRNVPEADDSWTAVGRRQRNAIQAYFSSQITVSSSQYFDGIEDELRTLILEKKASNEEVFEWINENLYPADSRKIPFIRALVTVVCEDTMDREDGGQCKCNLGRLQRRRNLLRKYIDDTNLELQALFAVQALFVQLDYPQGFIKSYFDSLYDEEIITEESFNTWESSVEEEQGNGAAIAASSEFFRWLRGTAEEPGGKS